MPISVATPPRQSRLAPPLRRLVRAALRLERRAAGEISVVLTDDPTLRDLNRRYRGIDRATDVLSFDYGDGEGRGKVYGDLVISLDRMRVQAKRYRVTRGRELARLVIHGTLHLAGLDHHRATERQHMRRREAEALRIGREDAVALDNVFRSQD